LSRSTLTSFAALLLVVGLTAGCGSSKHVADSHAQSHSTSIVFDHRIGPVSYGEPKAQISKALGHGIAGFRVAGALFTAYPQYGLYVAYTQPPAVYLDYRHPPKIKPPTAIHILTRSTQYKIHGIGVGSSLRQLQQQLAVVCFDTPRNVVTGPSFTITSHTVPTECQHGPTLNVPVTVFRIDTRTKRVTLIEIVNGECSVSPATTTLTVCTPG
jgi:hypothetical protein